MGRKKFVRRGSLSDEDIKGVIDSLMRSVGTQVAQSQNLAADTLFDAPLATKRAAQRGAEIRGSEVIGKTVPKIKLAQKQSVIDAERQYAVMKFQADAQAEAQSQSDIMGLFSSVGMLLAASQGLPLLGGAEKAAPILV